MSETSDEDAQAILSDLLDPGGTLRNTSRGIVELLSNPWLRAMAPELVSDLGSELIDQLRRFDREMAIGARASRQFALLGWALSSSSVTKDYNRALDAFDQGEVGRAEQVLVDLYDDDRLSRPARQIRMLGRTEEQREIYAARADLLDKAYEHHRAMAFEASVPIVLAQIEGLTADITGKMFFSGDPNRRAEIVENQSLATVIWSLPVVRAIFSAGQHETVVRGGGLSRHGVLHGRDLGYATELFSTKAFALLAAVVEWAQAELRRQYEERRREGEIRYLGSEQTDSAGARLDRREFSATRAALKGLYFRQLGWGLRRGGYNSDLLSFMTSEHDWRGLPSDHGVEMTVTPDHHNWWAWRRTITGWCFGIGARNLVASPWYFDGPEPPPGGPHEFPDSWVSEFESRIPPNWKG